MDVIFDIDGTLANNEHRVHYLRIKPQDWDSYKALSHLDEPIWPIVNVLQSLYTDYTYFRVILCTGRSEDERFHTEQWLESRNIFYDKLYMRPKNDHRQDTEIKLEAYKQMLEDDYDPKLVFEDRSSVVALWRSLGLVCCQVAEGDF